MAQRKWSQKVTQTSNAMDLEQGVFKKADPKAIARSLKRSAEQSQRRKSEPFRSAMSMLNLYINRAGKNLTAKQRTNLDKAKDELRALYGKEPGQKRQAYAGRKHSAAKRSSQKLSTANNPARRDSRK